MSENKQQFQNQISLARTEIKNLRQQISALKHEHLKEIKCIKNVLNGLRCASCGEKVAEHLIKRRLEWWAEHGAVLAKSQFGFRKGMSTMDNLSLITTDIHIAFREKKYLVGVFLDIASAYDNVLLPVLRRIMFHFHVTESNSVPAKVAPPRLSGERRGVFSTRSPHRPCPIGLSLVKITRIEGNKIHFLGVDMVNGTPVLDVKPYIPQYDHPSSIGDLSDRPPTEGTADEVHTSTNLSIEDGVSPPPGVPFQEVPSPGVQTSPPDSVASLLGTRQHNERGAPDGQEHLIQTTPTADNQTTVRVASWISNPPAQVFEVTFTSEAYNRLTELIGHRAETFKTNIQSLLSEDPRSHYVRTRYPDHEFSCVLEDLSISCLFDAGSSI
ncbi:Nef-associated protein 1 [Operophtera brumata]|uniref:Nef-associated protein 1 n=1 Tax=Operophtera brumata TaxID=104452 RepID=A0A0L7KXU0_OPEBR|nr:Nef-associated protein 1 [Operophtera brumata]